MPASHHPKQFGQSNSGFASNLPVPEGARRKPGAVPLRYTEWSPRNSGLQEWGLSDATSLEKASAGPGRNRRSIGKGCFPPDFQEPSPGSLRTNAWADLILVAVSQVKASGGATRSIRSSVLIKLVPERIGNEVVLTNGDE